MHSIRRSGPRGECENKKCKMILIYLEMYRKPRKNIKIVKMEWNVGGCGMQFVLGRRDYNWGT